MKVSCLVLAAASLAAGSAQAQRVDPAGSPQFKRQEPPQDQVFSKPVQPFPQPYVRNDAPQPDPRVFPGYRADPKLSAGFDLNRYFAIETGYTDLYSRGPHRVDDADPADRAGALNTTGFNTYLAGKLTLPVGDKFAAYAKVGEAYSERKSREPRALTATDVDAGAYTNVGSRYRLNDKVLVSGVEL